MKSIQQKWNVCLKEANKRTLCHGVASFSVDTNTVQLCIGDNINNEVFQKKIISSWLTKICMYRKRERDGNRVPLTSVVLKTAIVIILTITSFIGSLQFLPNQREKYWHNTLRIIQNLQRGKSS